MSDDCFTIVFLGKISDFKGNPYKVETPFGKPVTIGVGDAFEEIDELRDLLDALSPADRP